MGRDRNGGRQRERKRVIHRSKPTEVTTERERERKRERERERLTEKYTQR